MTVAAIIGPGLPAVLVTVALVNVPLFGRLTRSAVMSQLSRDYVTAAQVVGVSPIRVMFRHILPNSLDALIVQAALSLSLAVFLEGAMSFVGIGVRPPEPSLGSLLRASTTFLDESPVYAFAPMVVVTALVLGFNLIADGLTRPCCADERHGTRTGATLTPRSRRAGDAEGVPEGTPLLKVRDLTTRSTRAVAG